MRHPFSASTAAPDQPHRGRHAQAFIAAVLLVALAACARKDVKSELGRVRSWTSTTRLAAELRGVKATNGAVTTQLLQRAEQTHAKEQKLLARLAQTDSQRAAARGLLDSLQQGILKLQRAAK